MTTNGPGAADELRLIIERWERLDEEKKAIAQDQKDFLSEAKSRGFDTKAIREIIRLRKLSPDERREREAMVDTYKAALGMLDGTPLGKWALERLKKKEPEDSPPSDGEPAAGSDDNTASDDAPLAEVAPVEPPPSLDDARQLGGEAARGGEPVTANPFPAFDERRAAWDEAWCHELGSDGMEIPEALKPKPKPKKSDAE